MCQREGPGLFKARSRVSPSIMQQVALLFFLTHAGSCAKEIGVVIVKVATRPGRRPTAVVDKKGGIR